MCRNAQGRDGEEKGRGGGECAEGRERPSLGAAFSRGGQNRYP